MKLNELEEFEVENGQPLVLGMAVSVNPKCPYHADYRGGAWIVSGMRIEGYGRSDIVDVTIKEVGNRDDGGSDGFRPYELSVR